MNKRGNDKDFVLPLLFKAKSGDDVDMRIHVQAVANVEDSGLFKQKLGLDPSRLEPTQLVTRLSDIDELKSLVNLECAAYKADFLCDDPMVAERLIKKLEEPLRQALKERGLYLVGIEWFRARRLEIEEQIEEDIHLEDSIDRLLLDAEKKGLLKHSELERFKRSLAWEEEDQERDRRLEQLRKDYEQFAKENNLLRGWLLDKLEIEKRLASYRRQEQIKEARKERKIDTIKEGRGFPWLGTSLILVALVIIGIIAWIWLSEGNSEKTPPVQPPTSTPVSSPTQTPTSPSPMVRFTLGTSAIPPGAGSISPSGGTYDTGAAVTLIAAPALGFRFDRWSGDFSGTNPTITFTMGKDMNVIANFIRQYTLSTSVSPSGSGSVSPSSGLYDAGGKVILTAATTIFPYAFDHWSGTDNDNANPTAVTMSADRQVTAYFKTLTKGSPVTAPPKDAGPPIPTLVTFELNSGQWVQGQITAEYDIAAHIVDADNNVVKELNRTQNAFFQFQAQKSGLYAFVVYENYAPASINPGWQPPHMPNKCTLTYTIYS